MEKTNGKTALVTGGSRGIGRAICEELSREGWRVVINYRASESAAIELARSIGAETVRADVSDDRAARRMIEAYPELSLLVNNAGVAYSGLFHETAYETWREIFSVNLDGAANCARAAMPFMLRQKRGCIINISSIWGLRGASYEAAYSASKAALIGLTQALAREYGPSGIRVNCVAPGVIDTDMLGAYSQSDRNELISRTALCRLGTPADVAGAVLFLATEAASFITGQTLCVDGGFAPG